MVHALTIPSVGLFAGLALIAISASIRSKRGPCHHNLCQQLFQSPTFDDVASGVPNESEVDAFIKTSRIFFLLFLFFYCNSCVAGINAEKVHLVRLNLE